MKSAVQVAAIAALALLSSLALEAQQPPRQTPPPAQTPAPQTPAGQTPTAQPPRRPRPRPMPSQVTVRDKSGTPLNGVAVAVSGTASQDVTTTANGTALLGALRDGTYRLRF